MNVLGLDTSTLTAGIAIWSDGRIAAELHHDTSGRTADLLVAIDRACQIAGVKPRDLDAVAVGAGPGSFTGLRIGMATAKGIAFAAGRPLWAVSSLAALAYDGFAPHDGGASTRADDLVIAVLDARKSEVFVGAYLDDGVAYRRDGVPVEERVLAPAALAEWASLVDGRGRSRFVGDALAAYPDLLAGLADRWLPIATPSGAAVAELAVRGARVDVVTDGAPAYIRPAEAEVKYPDGVPGALRRR